MDLILERRGMDFYDGCPEKKEATDFDNFRLFGEIEDGHEGSYYLEITTHWRDNVKAVRTLIEFSHNYFDGMCYRTAVEWCRPTKKDVLDTINRKLMSDFTDIKYKED